MRIGLFGGMFDPPHTGHLNCVRQAASKFDLDKVLLLPAYSPPHKNRTIASPEERLAMTRLLVDGMPLYSVSDMEIRREGSSYTIDTLRQAKEELNGELFFITGGDAFAEVGSWKESDKLFRLANFIVIARPGQPLADIAAALAGSIDGFRLLEEKEDISVYGSAGTDNRIYFYNGVEVNASSTELRRALAQARFDNGMLPEKVAEYIKEKGIYGR